MVKNEGTVTIPIDRYLELTKFVDDISRNDITRLYVVNGRVEHYFIMKKDDLISKLEENNYDFERHNKALQERISKFNNKPWYQRVCELPNPKV